MWEQEQWRIFRSEMLAGSRGCPRGEHERRSLFTVISAKRHFPACPIKKTNMVLATKHCAWQSHEATVCHPREDKTGTSLLVENGFDGRDHIVD